MRRFNTELCHNIRWVIFSFAFVGVCFIQNGLRVDKTISVRLYGAFNSYQKTGGLYQIVVQTKHRINTGFLRCFYIKSG